MKFKTIKELYVEHEKIIKENSGSGSYTEGRTYGKILALKEVLRLIDGCKRYSHKEGWRIHPGDLKKRITGK